MQLYDDFSGAAPDPDKWVIGALPGPDGSPVWTWRDDNLTVTCADNRLTLDVPVFSLSHPEVPMFDNPKALYFATRQFPCADSPLTLASTLAAEFNSDPDDYRDGFAGFHALDFATGSVFDVISNGRHLWAIFELLAIPGLEGPVPPFTEVVELGMDTAPGREHSVAVRYDPAAGRAQWLVDGAVRLERDVPMRPQSLFPALGILTLRPPEGGRSISNHGQGGKGVFGPISYEIG